MGISRSIRNAMFHTAIATLNRVGVVGHGFSSRVIHHLQPVRKMHRHRQQPTKRRPSATLSNNHRPRTTDHDIAVSSGAVEGCGVEAVDENGAGDSAGDRAAAGRFISHARSGEAVEEDVRRAGNNRVSAVAWQWACGRVGDAGGGFSTQFKAPCFRGSGCGW